MIALGLIAGCGGGEAAAVFDAATDGDVAVDGGPDAGCGAVQTVAYQALAGVDPNLQSLDIYPACGVTGPAPVVIWS